MDIKKWGKRRVAIAASIAFVCGCGARSEMAEIETTAPASTPSSCPDDGGAGGGDGFWGCVVQAYDVNGADLGPTHLTLPEVPPGGGASSIEGYWVVGFNIAIWGGDGESHSIQVWGGDIDTLFCGKSLSLQPLMEAGPDTATLRWWGAATDYWASTSGTLHVIAFEPGVKLEPRPIHIEIHGASMAPGITEPGSGPNHATGTFTADLSCRLKKFGYVPPN
jgi:hypothetical protein